MNTTSSSLTRALVLGGGGSAGNAWLIGVVAGLSDGGCAVAGADLVVGTSAGSTAAAQLAGASATDLLRAIDAAPVQPRTGPPAGEVAQHLDRMRATIAEADDAADLRRRMGTAAIELAIASGGSERWRSMVAARLPGAEWPEWRMLITAVDAETGAPVTFDRESGVNLVDAVAASTSGRGAYRIGDRWYIDGGYRANSDNADLAAGYDRVLVLSPLGGKSLHPVDWGTHLATQVDALRAGGSLVVTVFPDEASLAAFGDNMMDHSTRQPAAHAGYEQGGALAEEVAALWA